MHQHALFLTGGLSVQFPLGRRDGWVSSASNVRPNMVNINFSLDLMTQHFSSKELSLNDLVVFSGAHTIGTSHYNAFSKQFQYDPKGNLVTIETFLEKNFVAYLIKQCSSGASVTLTVNNNAVTTSLFDNRYYCNLLDGKGLLHLISVLVTDARTKGRVEELYENQVEFITSWAESFKKLVSIGVKTGDEGEIRMSCGDVKMCVRSTLNLYHIWY